MARVQLVKSGGQIYEYSTITAAIGVSAAGDIIQVYPGTFNEASGETFPLTIPTSVGLVALGGPSQTTISSTAVSGSNAVITFDGGTLIQGFTIQCPNATNGWALNISSSTAQTQVQNCVIRNGLIGIRVNSNPESVVVDTVFFDGAFGSLISLTANSNSRLDFHNIRPSDVSSPPTAATSGISLSSAGTYKFFDCSFVFSSAPVICTNNTSGGTTNFYDSQLSGGTAGVTIAATTANVTLQNCTLSSNTTDITASAAGTITLKDTSYANTSGTFGSFIVRNSTRPQSTFLVDQAGTGDYRTITAALAAATSGTIIQVAPGTYNTANGETFPMNVPTNVSLISLQGAAQTIISSAVSGSTTNIVAMPGIGCTLSGFTIKNSTSDGICVSASSSGDCLVSNCVFGSSATAVTIGTRMQVTNCFFTGTIANGFTNTGSSRSALISNCGPTVISAPTFTAGFIVGSAFSATYTVTNCIFTSASAGTAGLSTSFGATILAYGCTISGMTSGVLVNQATGVVELHDCRLASNTTDITVTAAGSLRLYETPYATSSGLSTLGTFSVNGVPNPGSAGQFLSLAGTPPVPTWASVSAAENWTNVLIVNPGVSGYYASITTAIAAAGSGDIIYVMPGTYSVAATTETFPLTIPSGVSLVGLQGAQQTIISGVVSGGTDVLVGFGGNSATIVGFTIQNSTSNGVCISADGRNDCLIDNCVIGTCTTGISIGRRLRVENCQFTGTMNQAFADGGNYVTIVVGCNVSNTAPRFTNAFVNLGNGGTVELHSCFITTSTADTAVIDVSNGTCRAYDCTLGNQAIGIRISGASGAAEAHDCRFVSNTSDITVTAAGSLRLYNTPYSTSSGLATLATFSVNGVPNPGTAGQVLTLSGAPPVPAWGATSVTDVLTLGQGGNVGYTSLATAVAAAVTDDTIFVNPGTFPWTGGTDLTSAVDLIGLGLPKIQLNSAGTGTILEMKGEQIVEGIWVDLGNGSGVLASTGIELPSFSSNCVIKDVWLTGVATGNLISIVGPSGSPSARMYDIVHNGGTANKGLVQSIGTSYIHGWVNWGGGADDAAYFEITGGATGYFYDLDFGTGFGTNANLYNSASTLQVYSSNLGSNSNVACVQVTGASAVQRLFGCKLASASTGVDLSVGNATATVKMYGCEMDEERISITNGAAVFRDSLPLLTFCSTTDATPTDLSFGGLGLAWIPIPSNKLVTIAGICQSKRTDSLGDCISWRVEVTLLNNAGTTTLIDGTVTELANSGSLTWTLVPSADTTTDTLRLTFTGEAAKTVKTTFKVYSYSEF